MEQLNIKELERFCVELTEAFKEAPEFDTLREIEAIQGKIAANYNLRHEKLAKAVGGLPPSNGHFRLPLTSLSFYRLLRSFLSILTLLVDIGMSIEELEARSKELAASDFQEKKVRLPGVHCTS